MHIYIVVRDGSATTLWSVPEDVHALHWLGCATRARAANIVHLLIEMLKATCTFGNTRAYSQPQGKEPWQDNEIQRRTVTGSAENGKHQNIFKSNLVICLKRQMYNFSVLPAMTYDAETWTLTKQAQNKRVAAETKMERSMLNMRSKNRMTNIWVRERTKVIEIMSNVRKIKGSLAENINPPQRRPMDLACHHLETMRQENTTRENSQAVERRPGQILERHDLADDCARHANLEEAC